MSDEIFKALCDAQGKHIRKEDPLDGLRQLLAAQPKWRAIPLRVFVHPDTWKEIAVNGEPEEFGFLPTADRALRLFRGVPVTLDPEMRPGDVKVQWQKVSEA